MLVMMLRRLIIEAVGEPVGLKANWSDIVNVGGGDMKAAYRTRFTTVRSITRIRTGVMDIGRKSA